jgi:hypothetical protein
VNPALALALLAIAGLLAARLPRFSTPPSLALIRDGHVPLVLLGVFLGPVIGALDRPLLQAAAPVTAVAVGWWGARCGARFERRLARSVGRPLWNVVLGECAAVLVAVAGLVSLLVRFAPPLRAAWSPTFPVALTLAAVALSASARRSAPGSLARRRSRVAVLETACGALVALVALAPLHPRVPFGGGAFGVCAWLATGAAASVAVGLAFTLLAQSTAERHDLPLALLALLVLGAGVGYATGISPFLLCALAAAVMVNTSPQQRAVRRLLAAGSRLADVVLYIGAGALVTVPTWWIVPGALALVAARLAVKVVSARQLNPALLTVAQDGCAVALAVNYALCAGAGVSAGGAVVATVVLAVALSQAAARPLADLTPLTVGATRPELSASSSLD